MIKIFQEESDIFLDSKHRAGVFDCPYCNYDCSIKNGLRASVWINEKNIKEIYLRSRFGKADSVIILSECPKCFELSWVHSRLSCLIPYYDLPKNVIKELKQELKYRIDNGKKQWKDSLCRKCFKKILVTFNCYYPFVNCLGRSGRAVNTCERFITGK